MAENRTLNTRLRLKYDTAANWATKNPVLLAGEVGIESDTLLGKVGDGEKTWQQLEYLKAGSGAVRYDIDQILNDTQKERARANIDTAKSDHTHNYAGSDSVGGAAKSANKVNSNLIVKLNGGATEGTNLFTFNGSAAKTINITPNAIGAAASSHGTHVTTDTVKSALGIGSGTSKYLREDGTWQIPPDTHYTNYLQIKGDGTEAVKFTQNGDKILNFKPGNNVSISAAANEITISATNTDTKVTSADNHYSPTAVKESELTATINGTAGAYAKDTEYTVLTGVKVQRDAKGHVTGITYTAQKIKDTNTTYTIPTKSSWDYDDRYVKYTEEQELDNTQKEQARSNIGAGTSNLTLAGNGNAATAAKSDHSHNYAGSSSAGGAATSANKVNAALTFNNNGKGAVSGTTFDGSTARIISYNTIGAAASSHNHDDRYYTETEIDTKLSGKSDTNHNHDDKYLGKTAKAADSDKLDGKDSTYYLNYNNLSNKPSNATQSTAGLMSSEDKEHLDTLAALLENQSSTIDTITEVLKAFENAPEGTNIANALADKVDKVDGKGLSTNDFTTAEKEKLAGIESGANAYVLPAAGTSLGGVKSGGDVTITDGVITVNDDSHNHIISNIDGLQSALDGKANSSHTHSQYLTTHQAIKTLKTDNATAQSPSSSEAVAGSGTINLHKVSKTGSYNDLLNKLTAGSNITISKENIISAKDTTYTAGTGLSLLNGAFSVKTGYSTNGKNYKVTTDTSGNLYVNVPWTDTNTDTHYTNYLQIKGNNTEAVKFTQNADKTLNFKPGANVSISAVSGEITISSTDTNTATAADNILDGSNSGTQITYAPYTSQQSKLSFDTSTTNPTRTDRLNLNGYLYATKLYSGGKEVFTSHQSIKSINTNNTTAQAVANETVAGSGTINLHKVSKTGSYNDLLNRPTKLSDFTDDKVVKFTNTTVAASAFVADNNYSNYGYCASIGLSGVTANDTADIYFSGKQVEQEIYASFCESYAGGVKIYAAEKPSEAVIIPLILIHR